MTRRAGRSYLDAMSIQRHRTLSALGRFRKDKRLSLEELADLIGGVTPSAVSLWCHGKRRPKPDTALRIERRCGVPLHELLDPKGLAA